MSELDKRVISWVMGVILFVLVIMPLLLLTMPLILAIIIVNVVAKCIDFAYYVLFEEDEGVL